MSSERTERRMATFILLAMLLISLAISDLPKDISKSLRKKSGPEEVITRESVREEIGENNLVVLCI